jgi:hypothetical protein
MTGGRAAVRDYKIGVPEIRVKMPRWQLERSAGRVIRVNQGKVADPQTAEILQRRCA